ncbi:ester cyclase [Candidatus Micrarchaeota archaeon]|nr:ester cyclase [Candidatus Micrarchaeota archaeon]
MNESRKELAIGFLKMIVSKKIKEAYEKYTSSKMIHHNAYFPGDAKSLEKGMLDSHAKFPDTSIDIKRAIEEGEFVAVHSHVKMQPAQPGIAVVHLFRFENNKIVEMWDVGQEIPKNSPNKNGIF